MKIHQGFITAIALSSFALPALAETPETKESYLGDYVKVTAFLGAKLDIETDDGTNSDYRDESTRFSQAIALNWAYAKNAEGELLFSNSLRTGNINEHYIQYLHIGGRILFRNTTPFSTSIALGAGGTYINPTNNDDADTALSGSMAVGARYKLNEQFALRSDLRVYGTLLREGHNESLCSTTTTCKNGYFLEAELLAGVEYTF